MRPRWLSCRAPRSFTMVAEKIPSAFHIHFRIRRKSPLACADSHPCCVELVRPPASGCSERGLAYQRFQRAKLMLFEIAVGGNSSPRKTKGVKALRPTFQAIGVRLEA